MSEPAAIDVERNAFTQAYKPAENLEELNKRYGTSQRHVPYWIEKAEKFGYIFKGWTMIDYMKNTHIPAPHEYEYSAGLPKQGFENIITWGRQGTRKCLVGDTQILCLDGYKPIRKLRNAEPILSASGVGEVLAIGTTSRPVVEVKTSMRRIYSSPEHRFWTQFGWKMARNLMRGDRILCVDACLPNDTSPEFGQVRRWEEIQRVSRASEEERLYDITTSTGHFIADGLVVHNSNLNRQMMYGFLRGDDKEADWQDVLNYFLMTKQQIYDIYKMTTDEQVKVPYVTLDDITTTIPKQLFFVGMKEFIRFQQFIATIRMRIGIVGSNSPLPQNVISVLRDNISMEVICFPAGTYMTERYCWFPAEFKPTTAFLKKVLVEYRSWDFLAEPKWVFEAYDKQRWVITEEIVRKLQGDDAEPEFVIPELDHQEYSKAMRLCSICLCQSRRKGVCTCKRHNHDGIQIDDMKLRQIVGRLNKKMQEKASTVRAESLKDVQEVFGMAPASDEALLAKEDEAMQVEPEPVAPSEP